MKPSLSQWIFLCKLLKVIYDILCIYAITSYSYCLIFQNRKIHIYWMTLTISLRFFWASKPDIRWISWKLLEIVIYSSRKVANPLECGDIPSLVLTFIRSVIQLINSLHKSFIHSFHYKLRIYNNLHSPIKNINCMSQLWDLLVLFCI